MIPTLATLCAKEFREAMRSRWLIGFSIGFCLFGLGISWIGSLGSSMGGYSGFGRTTASLVNLILLIVPLMGLFIGAFSLSGERERGTLALLLSLPIDRKEIFWAKWIGLGSALGLSLSIAFGLGGIALAMHGGLTDGALYVKCFAVTLILALVSLSLGLLISSLTRRTAVAAGVTLLIWFVLVFGGDLGILGTSLAIRLSPAVLLASAWLNPLSLYRIIAIDLLGANLEMLGPAGHCAQDALGRWLLPAGFAGMFVWAAAALAVSYRIYIRDPLREVSR